MMGNLRCFVLVGVLLIGFPTENNAQTMYNLGTLLVSDTQPSTDEFDPNISNNCDENQCEGLVWIFLSDVSNLPQWGTINKEQFDGRDIMCRQLGYESSNGDSTKTVVGPDDSRVWLQSVTCGNEDRDQIQNILQCNPVLCEKDNQDCHNHAHDLVIKCKNKVNPEDLYLGSVHLAGPAQNIAGMQTTFGILRLKIHDKDSIRAITIKSAAGITSFDDSLRDSICKQMGFTRAVVDSVFTVGSLTNYDFERQQFLTSWFNVDDNMDVLKNCTNVDFVPAPCFRCCYNYNNIGDGGNCQSNECKQANSLVMACAYDSRNQHPHYLDKGSEKICKLDSNGNLPDNSVCKVPMNGSNTGYIVTIVIFIIILLALTTSILIFCLYHFGKLNRCIEKWNYDKVNGTQ